MGVIPERPDDEVRCSRVRDSRQFRGLHETHWNIIHEQRPNSCCMTRLLTSAVRAGNEVEAVQWLVRLHVHKVADGARRVVQPREGCDAALRGKSERNAVCGGDLDLGVDEVRVG